MKKVLVFEPEGHCFRLLEYLLPRCGIEMVVLTEADDAMDRARTEQPDLVLADMDENLDPTAIISRLRQSEETTHIPVVAMTLHMFPKSVQRALESGCVGIIEKPADSNRFVRQLTPYLFIPRP